MQLQVNNYNYLMNELAVVRTLLENNQENLPLELNAKNNWNNAALNNLCRIFSLTDFERYILLLCVGMELDPNWGFSCTNAPGGVGKPYPNFMLATLVLPQAHWNALTPDAPLRRWQLIQIAEGSGLNLSPLRIDERILHYLLGLNNLDERLQGVVKFLETQNITHVNSHQILAEQLATTWANTRGETTLPIIQLCGDEVSSKKAIASTACQLLNLNLYIMSAGAITNLRTNEINDLLRLWDREAMLTNSVLLLDCEESDSNDAAKESAIARLMTNISSPLIIISRERRRCTQKPIIAIDVPKPTTAEQRIIWQNALGEVATTLNGHVDILVSHFSLSAATIHTVCTEAIGKSKLTNQLPTPHSPLPTPHSSLSTQHSALSTLLWDTCRSQARSRLDELAQPIESGVTWDDLVLPEAQRQVLRDIAAHVRQRAKVYEQWGFGNKGGRGLGISALFAGASGTGKTMAAEVIANELRLDLYRIDLSQVVSKYIGETEKNLRRVFDAAEAGGAILLFDEADALFGKRSEVKDSHDRHANIEVGYLLQRMESYRGLAILTTNLKASLDQAFLRRIRFIVQFPFPDVTQRNEIWQRIFPQQTPTQDLDFSKLAKLNVSGGNIRNIALNAAFLAADAGEAVEMKYILQAAKSEYAKLERQLTDAEVKGWI
ncbi:ATP-binding protein [Aulosira sp. FACHB-615]|uniref:ATP-binding protein n=1 Tax=Aulosira sp. FACHB-615 TaxID=2692777 RepID=UPI001686A5BE|nr:ATP-binding protein [Aulosira sp. FACHB-615]MBD2489984.1 ATP-binding protein [Aulosira sp. FACHB-615]